MMGLQENNSSKNFGGNNHEREKNIDTSKQDNQPQEKFADELLSEAELDNVAGGTGGDTSGKFKMLENDLYVCYGETMGK